MSYYNTTMRHYVDDNEDIDDNGVVRDGQVLRASIFMMDSAQRAVVASQHIFDETNSATHHDQTIGEKIMAMREREQAAHKKYLTWLSNAWRDPSAPAQVTEDQKPTKDAATEPATLADAYAAYHQRLTTAYLNPPSMVPIIPSNNAESLLPPPSAAMTDEREKLLAQRNEQLENAWRNPL